MSDDLEARCHHAITHDGEAYIKLADASVTFSLYRKDIATKAARIAELEAALATARRDAMEEAAQDLEGRAKMLRSFDPDSVGAHWAWHYAAAIRAALEGGKDEC